MSEAKVAGLVINKALYFKSLSYYFLFKISTFHDHLDWNLKFYKYAKRF